MIRRLTGIAARLAIGAFFLFVGYMKAAAPLTTLAEHHAWTVFLPAWLGRAVGWSELACAAALLLSLSMPLRRGALAAATILAVNQVVAASVHLAHGGAEALPQNAILVLLLAAIGWSLAPPARI